MEIENNIKDKDMEIDKLMKELDLIPVKDAILIKQDTYRSKSNIYIPNEGVGSSLELYSGTVLCCGDLVASVKPRDRIIFSHVGYSRVSRNNQEYVLLYEGNVICKIDPKKEKKC